MNSTAIVEVENLFEFETSVYTDLIFDRHLRVTL